MLFQKAVNMDIDIYNFDIYSSGWVGPQQVGKVIGEDEYIPLKEIYLGDYYVIIDIGEDVNKFIYNYSNKLRQLGINPPSNFIEFNGQSINIEYVLDSKVAVKQDANCIAFAMDDIEMDGIDIPHPNKKCGIFQYIVNELLNRI